MYEEDCDCIVDTQHRAKRWIADGDVGSFVAADGEALVPGWKVNVGFANFTRVITDPRISGPFFGTLLWNFGFALGSVVFSFALGVTCALALNSSRMRGRRLYRSLLVLPYAMPSFAMLLVWRDMFNTDFGLINRLLGLGVDWLGGEWTARASVLLVNTWLGYPYMFLIALGALQAIPRELTEAAHIDGAGPWQAFRRVTLPLLMVALTPLLIASFAYNFNNFNAIELTSGGGPFAADSPLVGATDLLITYTYRLAFGGSGAQYGFAAAVSVYIFLIVAVVSAITSDVPVPKRRSSDERGLPWRSRQAGWRHGVALGGGRLLTVPDHVRGLRGVESIGHPLLVQAAADRGVGWTTSSPCCGTPPTRGGYSTRS